MTEHAQPMKTTWIFTPHMSPFKLDSSPNRHLARSFAAPALQVDAAKSIHLSSCTARHCLGTGFRTCDARASCHC